MIKETRAVSPTLPHLDAVAGLLELMAYSKITGLIASCDLEDRQPFSANGYCFRVSELAQLANGDLVLLRDDLGWTNGIRADGRPEITDVLSTVKMVVLPDEDDQSCEPHPWEWLVYLAAQRGLSVTAEQLKEVPYNIYVSARVVELCQ